MMRTGHDAHARLVQLSLRDLLGRQCRQDLDRCKVSALRHLNVEAPVDGGRGGMAGTPIGHLRGDAKSTSYKQLGRNAPDRRALFPVRGAEDWDGLSLG